MKRLAVNVIFYLLVTVPVGIASFLLGNPAFAIPVVIWFFMPCNDRDFGNGRRWYKWRQLSFLLGAFIVALLGTL